MSSKRKSDAPGARTRFRSDRLQEDGGKWYFTTREGTLEGPFEDQFKALDALQAYAKSMEMDILQADSSLALASN